MKYEFKLEGLDCANCANKIQNKIAENKNYENVIVNFNTQKLSFNTDVKVVDEEIVSIVKGILPKVEVINLKVENKEKNKGKKVNVNIIRLIVGVLIMAIALIVKMPEKLNLALIILAYIILLFRTAKNALILLKKGTFNENFLVTLSCVGAFLINEKTEGLMVIILYEIGKILEEKAVNNTRKSISDLMDIRPEYANQEVMNIKLIQKK